MHHVITLHRSMLSAPKSHRGLTLIFFTFLNFQAHGQAACSE